MMKPRWLFWADKARVIEPSHARPNQSGEGGLDCGNHMFSGLASVIVALLIFGCFSLYNLYQEQGGLEGMAKQLSSQANQKTMGSPSTLQPPQN
ncbi:hypothetical protein [Pseudomonas mosselii]|uniref:hypothetical protein n=1 Tax=Pseudomonas mosselii TaxID=78327 RepID=UPI003F2BEBE0